MKNIWILADATETDGGEGDVIGMEESTGAENAVTAENGKNGGEATDQPQTKLPGSNMFLYMMLPLLLVYMFFMFRGPKKKQQEHNKLVFFKAKNHRVRTIGGNVDL